MTLNQLLLVLQERKISVEMRGQSPVLTGCTVLLTPDITTSLKALRGELIYQLEITGSLPEPELETEWRWFRFGNHNSPQLNAWSEYAKHDTISLVNCKKSGFLFWAYGWRWHDEPWRPMPKKNDWLKLIQGVCDDRGRATG